MFTVNVCFFFITTTCSTSHSLLPPPRVAIRVQRSERMARFPKQGRAFVRCLHLYHCREGAAESVLPLGLLTSEVRPPRLVDRVALGVGGVAIYSSDSSNKVYLSSSSIEAPPNQWACLSLPRMEGVKCVCVGRTHLATLTHSHTGMAH